MVWTSGGGIDEAGVGRSCRNAVVLRWAVMQCECESVQEVGKAGSEKSKMPAQKKVFKAWAQAWASGFPMSEAQPKPT